MRLIILFVFTFLMLNCLKAQSNNVIAKVGNEEITMEEFLRRFEFSPHARTETAYDSATIKKDFLYTLIAEKVLSQKAQELGIQDSYDIKAIMKYLSDLYLRDELYQKEVKDKVHITKEEIDEGKFKISRTLKVKFVFSQDKNEIDSIYTQLGNGAPFDSLLQLRSENNEQPDAAEVTFGTMNKAIEDSVYKLLPGQFTSPIKLREGWYICKVYDVDIKQGLNQTDLKKIEDVISSRQEDIFYEDFYKRFFKGISINANRILFDEIYKYILKRLEEKYSADSGSKNKFDLNDSDIETIKQSLSPKLDSVFIKFDIDPVTVEQFLTDMKLTSFWTDSLKPQRVYTILNSFVATYIQNTLLSREAKKRRYDEIPEVKNNLKMWKDFYLANRLMSRVFSGIDVTDKEAMDFYEKNGQAVQAPDTVNVLEIFSKNLDVIAAALNDLQSNSDFEKAARIYNDDDSLKLNGGNLGYFPVTEKGEIGKQAGKLKVGEIFGPIKNNDGYSLIKLIDKKRGRTIDSPGFEEAKNDLKNVIRTKKMYESLDNLTAGAAVKYGITINEKFLGELKTSTINMLVFRRFGFGGQITAVPYTPLFATWYKVYLDYLKKSVF